MSLKQTYGSKFRPDLEYMTTNEMITFKDMVESGYISIFRMAKCDECGESILKGKKFCSTKCWKGQDDERG